MVTKIEMIQVDAFTDKIFAGNPAGVCILGSWLSDDIMQKIASENNLSETSFIVKEANGFRIRWFTPILEVDLCGHATLASAHVFFNHHAYPHDKIVFNSKSGPLPVSKEGDFLKMDFPEDPLQKVAALPELEKALNIQAIEIYKGKTDYLCILDSEETVRRCMPDFRHLKSLDVRT